MIEIYGAKWCGFCRRAKQLCEMKDVEFEYYDVDDGNRKQELFDRMVEKPETIPQVFVNNEHLPGGFNGLEQYLKEKAA